MQGRAERESRNVAYKLWIEGDFLKTTKSYQSKPSISGEASNLPSLQFLAVWLFRAIPIACLFEDFDREMRFRLDRKGFVCSISDFFCIGSLWFAVIDWVRVVLWFFVRKMAFLDTGGFGFAGNDAFFCDRKALPFRHYRCCSFFFFFFSDLSVEVLRRGEKSDRMRVISWFLSGNWHFLASGDLRLGVRSFISWISVLRFGSYGFLQSDLYFWQNAWFRLFVYVLLLSSQILALRLS